MLIEEIALMFKGNCAIFSDYNQLTAIIISILHPLVKLMKLFELPLLQHFLQKHVRDVHLALSLLWCGIPFKDVGDADVKHRGSSLPSSSIRRSRQYLGRLSLYGFTAFQNHQSVIELTFATGGQPDVFGKKEEADDCGLL